MGYAVFARCDRRAGRIIAIRNRLSAACSGSASGSGLRCPRRLFTSVRQPAAPRAEIRLAVVFHGASLEPSLDRLGR